MLEHRDSAHHADHVDQVTQRRDTRTYWQREEKRD